MLPGFFPATCKACKTTTDTLFACLDAHEPTADAPTPDCSAEAAAYTTCMRRATKSTPNKFFRVAEAYR